MGPASLAMGCPLYLLLLLVFLVLLVGSIGLRGARRRNGRLGVGFVMDSMCRMTTLRRYRLNRRRRRYFVFEFGTKKGMQCCQEYYEMKNSARQEVHHEVEQEEEEVFDLVGVAEAEGWDQTELMYFVFEYGTKKGVQFYEEFTWAGGSTGGLS